MTGVPVVSPQSAVRALGGRYRPWTAWALGLVAGAAGAVALAADAHVAGLAAVPDVLRAAVATVVVFGICGLAPALALTPPTLAVWWPVFVLPLGAITSGMSLTLLGFAAVPFHAALWLTLGAGAIAAMRTWSRRPSVVLGAGGRFDPQLAAYTGLASLAALLVAIALIPTFRSGLATVTGFGSDAHLVTGSATFLQHNYPSSTDVAYPVDQVPPLWRSKYPIYYALAAVSSVGGLEPWQALMTVAAIVLVLAGLGWFLLARTAFGAPLGAAAAAMAICVLDRQVFHLALHPYYNQLWGMLTLPWSLVAAWNYVQAPTRRALALFAGFTVVGAFAYPLMLPFPLLAAAGFWLLERRERRVRGESVAPLDPRRLWRSRRSLLWMVPVGLLLAVPIVGVVQKVDDAVSLIGAPRDALAGWQGDLRHYPLTGEFFAVSGIPLATLFATALIVLAFIALARAPRPLGRSLIAVLGAALVVTVYFRLVPYGQYFYFKVLSFTAPQLLVAAVAALGAWTTSARSLARRLTALAAIVALCGAAMLSTRDEIASSYDQLTPETLQLREWSRAIPAGASIRLDTSPPRQLWEAYMLSDHPLGSRNPLTDYPHVPLTQGADYVLDQPLLPPPAGAGRAPVRRNSELRLWRLHSRAADTTSRRMVPIFSRNAPAISG